MDRSRTIGKNGLPLSSVMELELAALNESYANLSNTVPTINSTNGMLYLSNPGTGKDGVQTLGDNYVSLQSLRNRMKAKVDMYDVKSISAAAVASLGENTISQLSRDKNFRRTGVVTTTTDATKLTQIWAEFTEKTAEDMITNPFAKVSILADAMGVNPKNGKAYTGVYNRAEWEADKTGNLILFENTNGTGPLVPVFTDQQTKDAKEFVKAGFSKYVDRKENKQTFTEPGVEYPPEYIIKNREAAKNAEVNVNSWNQLYWGTPAQKKAALANIKGSEFAQSRGLTGIDLTTLGKVVFTFTNKDNVKRVETKTYDPKKTTLSDWAKIGNMVHGVDDITNIVNRSGGGSNIINTNFDGIVDESKFIAPPVPSTLYVDFIGEIASSPVIDYVVEDDATSTATKLNAKYKDKGFTFKADEDKSWAGTKDNIKVSFNGKVIATVPMDNDKEGARGIQDAISSTLKAQDVKGSKYNK